MHLNSYSLELLTLLNNSCFISKYVRISLLASNFYSNLKALISNSVGLFNKALAEKDFCLLPFLSKLFSKVVF